MYNRIDDFFSNFYFSVYSLLSNRKLKWKKLKKNSSNGRSHSQAEKRRFYEPLCPSKKLLFYADFVRLFCLDWTKRWVGHHSFFENYHNRSFRRRHHGFIANSVIHSRAFCHYKLCIHAQGTSTGGVGELHFFKMFLSTVVPL